MTDPTPSKLECNIKDCKACQKKPEDVTVLKWHQLFYGTVFNQDGKIVPHEELIAEKPESPIVTSKIGNSDNSLDKPESIVTDKLAEARKLIENYKEKIDFILGDCDMPSYPDVVKKAGICFTDYLAGAHKEIFATDPKTGKNYIYTPDRNRQCSIGYHLECSDKIGNKCGCVCHQLFIIIESLLKQQDLISRSEQREEDANRLKSLLEQNLETEEYFGVFGEVNNKQFIEDFKNS